MVGSWDLRGVTMLCVRAPLLPPWGLPRSSARILIAKVCVSGCTDFHVFLPNGICAGFKRRCHSCFFRGGSEEDRGVFRDTFFFELFDDFCDF